MIYKKTLKALESNFKNNEIKESDMSLFISLIDKEKLISILNDILSDEILLNIVANRSYTHALGFDKIVLMDLSKDIKDCNTKTQLRFHLWDAKNEAVPMVESMHEHSFNFISMVLSGKLENQTFKVSDLNKEDKLILDKLSLFLKNASEKEKMFLNNQLEIIEAIKLKDLGSNQLSDLKMIDSYNLMKTINLTGFSENDLFRLTSIEGHYVSNRIGGEKKAYKHIFNKYLSISPIEVKHIEKDQYYFHDYKYPHRLYYDNKILNSTILITTPIKSNPQGGSLQRPTYIEDNEKGYDKKSISIEKMKIKLENYIKFLTNN